MEEYKSTKYPVQVHFDRYGGKDPRKLKRAGNFNRIAGLVQEYINDEVAKWPMDSQGTFFSDVIAEAIHQDIKFIQLVLAGIGGSLNVVTIYKATAKMRSALKPLREDGTCRLNRRFSAS